MYAVRHECMCVLIFYVCWLSSPGYACIMHVCLRVCMLYACVCMCACVRVCMCTYMCLRRDATVRLHIVYHGQAVYLMSLHPLEAGHGIAQRVHAHVPHVEVAAWVPAVMTARTVSLHADMGTAS